MDGNFIFAMFLTALAAMWTGQAKSETLATIKNKSGGQMVLTDVKCSSKPGLVAYSASPKGGTLFGCWFYDDQYVFITWSDGETRTYPKSGWYFPKLGTTTNDT